MDYFIDDNFLLETDYAQELYHTYAKNQPIIDYHNHLPVHEIAEDIQFKTITSIWLEGDHYKWRAMRSLGVAEDYITGAKSDKEKFDRWAYTLPYALRNPLYHWSHLELQRYFNIEEYLNPETSTAIYERCNTLLKTAPYTTRGLIDRMNVTVLCTTDDPLDDLSHHRILADSDFKTDVFPAFRPDNIIDIEKTGFVRYMQSLSRVTGVPITDLSSLLQAVKNRIDYFHEHGCRLSDHGLPYMYSGNFTEGEINAILQRRFAEKNLTETEIHRYKAALLFYLGTFYADKNWTMQLHLGPVRDVNTALLKKIGRNAGVDSIGDYRHAERLAAFLNRLNDKGSLPKTVLYNSNATDNEVFVTMAGNFSAAGIKTKVQAGAAWWFLDQKEGITKNIEALSNMGLLSCSLGMLTDSRSFLSFPRHEYYRRILCNIFGTDIKKGMLPKDIKWIGKIIGDICYHNAREYFKFPKAIKTPHYH